MSALLVSSGEKRPEKKPPACDDHEISGVCVSVCHAKAARLR
jgi:hypothetical protein